MKRLLFLLLWASSLLAANDVYITQSGGGAGSSCGSAQSAAYFNNAANWSLTPTGIQIGPDTTVHLCNMFTGSANTTMLTTQGNGISGHPVIIRFESGAVLSSPAWGINGAISVPNNYVTVDGGPNGTIQNTLDGLAGNTACLGGTCTVQQAITIGVSVSGTHVIVTHLKITHMCMHTWNASDGGFFRGNCEGASVTGDNSLVTQNYIDNTATGVAFVNVNTCEAGFNSLSATSRNFVIAMTGIFVGTGPCKLHNNHISSPWIWDSADNQYHHNGVQIFTSGANQGMNDVRFYYNLLDGVWGKGATGSASHVTSSVFVNDAAGTNKISTVSEFRNVFAYSQSDPICLGPVVGGVPTCPASTPTNSHANVGSCTLAGGCTPANNSLIANNTMVGISGGGCFHVTDVSGSTQSYNNLCATNSGGNVGGTNVPGTTSNYPSANINYNLYPGVPGTNAFTVSCPSSTSGCNANSWSVWKGSPYLLDVNCSPSSVPPGAGTNCNPTLASANLGANFKLSAGSTAINAGKNLSSKCSVIPELCVSAPSTFGVGGANDGVAASPTGNWDDGAYVFNGAAPNPPAPPTGVVATPH